jgi:isoquinoline 1-oxidoreductase beta subunit
MNAHPKFNRRSFLVGSTAAVGGLSLGFHIPFGNEAAAGETPEVNAWVLIKPDETVVVRIARSEMGQGTLTGLAQMVAEELGCDWSKVTYEFPTPGQNVARKRVWGEFSTVGSQGIRTSAELVRKGGAAARLMLVQAAADSWKVPASECTAAGGVVAHGPSKRSLRYGQLADAAAKLTPPDPKEITLKDPKDWKILGKPLKRLDTPLKVNGKAQFGIDVRLPGMLYAALKACPVNGGKLKSFDGAKIEGRKGVKKVVKVEDYAVAVIADSWWRAKTALEALPIEWDEGPNAKVSSESIANWLKEGLDADTKLVANKGGDVAGALQGTARKIEAVYSYPYQAHATLEPMNATALYTPDKCEVWGSTQNAEASLATASEASGLPISKCDFYKTFVGGGFGRRGAGQKDYVRQAVLIAKEIPGTPVKLVWTREEDTTHDWYHPITQCKITAGLDKDNNLVAIHYRISGQSILAGVAPNRLQDGRDPATFSGFFPGGAEAAYGYSVPNILVDHSMRNPHLTPGFWRGVNINQNAIYIECFMDELAKEVGMDALEFRRKLMDKHPKHLAVLNAVAERAGWGKPAAAGVHRGLAQCMAYGSYVAACAEVSVDGNKVKIHRIIAATDPGHVANPAQIERQTAGSFVYGLTALFLGGITIKDGKVEQENFDSYDMMRIKEMPKVETIIMPSGGFWGGVGEPTIAVGAPAVLNAIANATGKRYRTFPLRDHGLYLV